MFFFVVVSFFKRKTERVRRREVNFVFFFFPTVRRHTASCRRDWGLYNWSAGGGGAIDGVGTKGGHRTAFNLNTRTLTHTYQFSCEIMRRKKKRKKKIKQQDMANALG